MVQLVFAYGSVSQKHLYFFEKRILAQRPRPDFLFSILKYMYLSYFILPSSSFPSFVAHRGVPVFIIDFYS